MRKINKRILILCEGVTEYLYAKALQMELPRPLQRSVAIEIDYSSQNDPLSLVKEAVKRTTKARKERNPYDAVWLFFDHDNHPRLQAAFELAAKQKFELAYTAICFEHWLILHYENCGRAFGDADEALKYLRGLWPAYHKTKSKAFAALRDRLEMAMVRAAVLMANQEQSTPIHSCNPHFTVPELISFIWKLKSEEY